MTSLGNPNMTYADLERLLEVYGSDRTRWPHEARAQAGQLVARDAAARRLLAEVEALDRILDRAPLPSLAREAALAERIAAAAQRSPRMVPPSDAGRVSAPATSGHANGHGPSLGTTSLSPASLGSPSLGGMGQVVRLPVARSRLPGFATTSMGSAAGVLAASLLVGIFIGMSSLPQALTGPLEQATGLTLSRATTAVAQIDPLDEDLL